MRRILTLIFATVSCLPALAQFVTFGTDPSSVKWRQIRSDHFKLVYPQEIDSLARVYMMTLEAVRDAVNEPVQIDPDPIPVVLHPYTTISNGMVAWCPKGVHLITSPDAYGNNQMDWVYQLCTHELRHVAQSEHFTRKPYNWLYPLLGESITGAAMGLFANTLYMEGDAVMAETMLSRSGRGRMASFTMKLRADYLDGFYRNVEGHFLSSHRYKPYDKYAVGYMLMATEMLRRDDWHHSGAFFHTQSAWLGGYAMKASKRPDATYEDNLGDVQRIYTKVWKDDLATRGDLTVARRLTDSTRLYCDYTGAMFVSDTLSPFYGNIIALKEGMEYPAEMIRIDTLGREHHLRYHAYYSSKMSSDDNGRLYWSESVMHDPSSLESFSEIKYYDVRRDRLGTLTHNTRYFNPSVCDCGNHMAVAEYPIGQPSRLVILAAADGSEVASAPAPGGGQIIETVFVGDNIYASVSGSDGAGIWKICEYDVFKGNCAWEAVLEPQGCEIKNLRTMDDGFCFASDVDGVLNIYKYCESDNSLSRITNSKYGVNYPFFDSAGRVLYFSEFDGWGYHIAKIPADSAAIVAYDWSRRYRCPVNASLEELRSRQSKAVVRPDSSWLDPAVRPSKKYRKLLNSFKIHSWAPFYYNIDRIMNMSGDNLYEMVSLGAVAYSQNDLGNVTSMLGYSYHGGFHSAHAKVGATVADCDFEISADFNDSFRALNVWENDTYVLKESSTPALNVQLTADYPFNLYGGGWQSALVPYATWSFANNRFDSPDGRSYFSSNAALGLRYYRMLSVATNQIFPRWGFSLTAVGDLSTASRECMPLAYFSGYAYVPGVVRSQALKISLSAQHRFRTPGSLYYNRSYASMPRGYAGALPSVDFCKLSLDYAIPIWLGDITVPRVIYIKRLQLIPFGDWAVEFNGSGIRKDYWSYGTDATIHFNLLRLRANLNAGVRYARTAPLEDGGNRNTWSFLFGFEI